MYIYIYTHVLNVRVFVIYSSSPFSVYCTVHTVCSMLYCTPFVMMIIAIIIVIIFVIIIVSSTVFILIIILIFLIIMTIIIIVVSI